MVLLSYDKKTQEPRYIPNCADPSKTPNWMTPSGKTLRQSIIIEETAQRAIAENPRWLIARKTESGRDSRKKLEALGFKVLSEYCELFYRVRQPRGWDKSTRGFWTSITDSEGKEVIVQYFQGPLENRKAHLKFKKKC
ncbi:hypothetical protein GF318_01625 [Candidatus Micrarchaeota archaeon]|nr:hypothetical protein [Candidatus Micrarchaeota archaeon]